MNDYAKTVAATKAAGGPAASTAPGATGTKTVATPSDDHIRLMKLWKLPRALMQGTRGMRAAGARATGNAAYTDWLPREPAELPAAYTARLYRSTLFNAFKKTVKDMTGKVFQKEITINDDVPDELKALAENIDLAGRHLNVFGRDVFYDGMVTGINYLLVDMPPKVVKPDGSPPTIADEAGRRPYLCHIKSEDLLGFKSETIGGVLTLTQARIREDVSEPDGDFNETCVEQIRVLEIGKWSTWRKQDTGAGRKEWALYQQGLTLGANGQPLAYVNLVPVYINRTGFMLGEPPLEDLADLNVAHWQSSSDQRNILHVARVPILFGAGFSADDTISVGANTMVRTTDVNAKLTWVEHTGAAIAAGQTDLDKIEFQMQVQGLQLMTPKPGGKTATGEVLDNSKENSPLAMMAMALGDALEAALGMMADFLGVDIVSKADVDGKDRGGSIDVNTDYGLDSMRGDLQQLIAARQAGDISRETLWDEMQRRDYLGPAFDPDIEKDRLASEPPPLDGTNLLAEPGSPKPAPPKPGAAA